LPLASYRVNWGDGNKSIESGLKINSKPSADDPFILAHYYKFNESCSNPVDEDKDGTVDYCIYHPKVQVEDNWDMTGDKLFGQEIRVYRTGFDQAAPADLEVSFNDANGNGYLDFDGSATATMPQEQSFEVVNSIPVGKDLYWEISDVSDDTIFDVVKLLAPYYEGYDDGHLKNNQRARVTLEMENIGNLATGTYRGSITVRNINDYNDYAVVNTQLTIP